MAVYEFFCPACSHLEESWGTWEATEEEVLVCPSCGEILVRKFGYGKQGGFQLHGVGWAEDSYMYVCGKNNTSKKKGKRIK